MHWLFFSGIAVTCFTTFNLVSRVVALEAKNERAYGAIWGIACGIVLLPVLLWSGIGETSFNYGTTIAIVAAVLFYTVYNRLQFTVRKHIQASDAAVLSQIAPIVSLFTLRIIAAEPLSAGKLLAAACILGGNILILWNPSGRTNWRGLLIGIALFGSLGIAFGLDKIASQSMNLPAYMMLIYFIPGVITGITPPLHSKIIRNESNRNLVLLFILAAVTVIGGFSALHAFRLAEGGKVILANSSSATLSVLLGIILLGEKNDILIKITAAVLVTIGIVLLAMT